MKIKKVKINQTLAWKHLAAHATKNHALKIKDQFKSDANRFENFSIQVSDLFLDYSKNKITEETVKLLINLAQTAKISDYRQKIFKTNQLNFTENRAVLHPALRGQVSDSKINQQVTYELDRLKIAVEKILNRSWLGYTKKPITDVVHLGIGGSDLGPRMVVNALKPYATNKIKLHFVSNIDAADLATTLHGLSSETTVFIIASKTFTTQETMTNATFARKWFLEQANHNNKALANHFIGITAAPQKALEFGIVQDKIFPFWDWVGGRFSLWSTIGLSIALAIGMDNFYQLLAGARIMDEHFKSAPLKANLPVIMALLGIWNTNFLGAQAIAIEPYDHSLSLLPDYLQQLEMESNGKRVGLDGSILKYQTSPIIWGGIGTNCQHSFHQLLMQGTSLVPVDFIIPLASHYQPESHHNLLYANCLAQSQALMNGKTTKELAKELESSGLLTHKTKALIPYQVVPGNIPTNTLVIMDKLTPKALGQLLALYEHKAFVQGLIWQINSFDQYGVELGKKLTSSLVTILNSNSQEIKDLDDSTRGLVTLKKQFNAYEKPLNIGLINNS